MSPINYVPLMDTYYQGQGFSPFKWSIYDTSPWAPLRKPLKECKVALHTSGGISRSDQIPFNPLSYNDLSFRLIPKDSQVDEFVINNLYYDHDDADKDINIIFPIERFRELENESYFREFVFAISGPNGRIYKRTALMEEVVPQILAKLKEAAVDVLFIIPACVLDHQTMGVVARGIEQMGIATIYVGVAKDIILQVRPPRAVFLDFPFGHNIGKAFNLELQMSIIKDAFKVLETAKASGILGALPYDWGDKFEFTPGAYRQKKIGEFVNKMRTLGREWSEISLEAEKRFGLKFSREELKRFHSENAE